ncbi:MAG: tryptophan synthase subunit alpha [Candidatus Nitrosopelagicus sp.]|jgi:tryptophan synthase alpha chain|nr:tryptophan synthase subunit alpha [Candidatus Nitrosopelagicus sp.]|tara:strand:+ start:13 stop:810 length:798 start_codon:yes stop_codon:yes gene_type:complete
MSRIKEKFNELKSKKEKALVSYIMVGYPSESATLSAIRGLVKGGADIIELGFPFSDPIADGPVIQKASTGSLNNGIKIEKFFKLVKKIRSETNIPLILMTYTNILYKQGYQKFIKTAKNAGIDGLILPDMAIEESKGYLLAAKKQKMDTIFLVSPNTQKNRLSKIAKATSGFLYMVAVFGTTGIQTKIHQYTIDALKSTKRTVKNVPVGVGFGISNEKDVKKYVSVGADAVIVGSANIKIMENTPKSKLEGTVFRFTKKLKRQTK